MWRASLMAQRIKHLPAMWETQVWSLGWEDPLEKEMATHSSILTWRIPRTEEPGELRFMGSQRVRHDQVTNTHTHTLYYNLKALSWKKNTIINWHLGEPIRKQISIVQLSVWTQGGLSNSGYPHYTVGFPGGSGVKNMPAKQETQVWSLGWEDTLEKGMATHSSILA